MADLTLTKGIDIAFMKWHEDGYITLVLDHESTIVSEFPIEKDEWRGYKKREAWDRDYWYFSEEEEEFLQSIAWEG